LTVANSLLALILILKSFIRRKMKILKKILKTALLIIIVLVLGFIGLIMYAVISDYKPGEKELISESDSPSLVEDSLTLSFLTWNIGYGGLDKDMDFFKDGGTKSITPEANCRENFAGIGDFLSKNDTIDFMYIQEIDRDSKRSYHIDEYDNLSKKLPGYKPFFAMNYDVFFVPVPPARPYGKVISGIATFSKYAPESSTRYSLPGDFGFPTQLFMLDRCFMVNRYKMKNGKELVLINTHNEAFDKGGIIRNAQMQKLREYVVNEYNSGNYVVAGGDWNQYPPGFKPAFSANKEFTGEVGNFNLVGIEPDYMPGEWKWIYDPAAPSFRTLIAAYDPATTPTSVCDIFLISPNLESVSVKCCNLGFANSDHNPVIMKVKLK
jgi:endonuclease/exonuclease/phosphatase family metal-dependent hydrolase